MLAAVFAVVLQQAAAVIVGLLQGTPIQTAPESPPHRRTTPCPGRGHGTLMICRRP